MREGIVISLKNVSKYYKLYNNPKDRFREALSFTKKIYHEKFHATSEVNLEVKKGEILGIVGKNGSGKSTLLKLITSVLTPDEGSVEVKGKISALLELGSGFNPEFTGIQNIFFYGTILGFSKKEMQEKLDEIISFADIGEFIYQPLKTYSSGMKTRLGFSVAIHVNPEILILDEVLSVGDIHFKRKSYAKMQEFFDSGKTIIYVSHSSGEVNRLCTRAIMLHAGKILMDGEPKEVTKQYEKYLFAKAENREAILLDIKQNADKPKQQIKKRKKKNTKSDNSVPNCGLDDKKQELSPYLIPDLVPQSRVEYDDTLLKIDNIKIKTLDGIPVNVLVTNERYIYSYRLSFLDNFYNVDFGMQIHDEKGVLISGCKEEESVDFKSGDVVEVSWEFDCLMHQGTYYTSIGVNHLENGNREYINRVVDALMFKVLQKENCCNGLVYLKQSPPILNFTQSDT